MIVVRRAWRAARVIAVSSTLRDLALRTWPEGRIEVIPNGVDVDRFQPCTHRDSAEVGGEMLLVVVARLIEIKEIQHLITALSLLPEVMRKRMRVCVCGTGPFADQIHAQVRKAGLADRVDFAGLLSYENIPARLKEADVCVLPSLQEGLPLSLLEAMASGLPVVASSVGGIPDIVKDGVNGLLVPAADPVALREALVRLLTDPALRRNLGAAARRTAEAWSWTAVWERYEKLGPAGAVC